MTPFVPVLDSGSDAGGFHVPDGLLVSCDQKSEGPTAEGPPRPEPEIPGPAGRAGISGVADGKLNRLGIRVFTIWGHCSIPPGIAGAAGAVEDQPVPGPEMDWLLGAPAAPCVPGI